MRHPLLTELPSPLPGKTGWPWTEASLVLPETMPGGSLWPRISIVTPSYNQGQFIEETIRSVLLQGYPNLEYIIIDGGSTDGSVEIIKKYEPWLAYWVSEKDDGQTFAIKKGMEIAGGQIVNWLNSDDYLLPNSAQALAMAYLAANTDECVLCGDAIHVAETGKPVGESRVVPYLDKVLPGAPPLTGGIQASWFLSRQAWKKVGGIDLGLNYAMDIDLYYRCNKEMVCFLPVGHTIAAYRRHEATKTKKVWKASIEEKERFYFEQLAQLDRYAFKIYEPRIRRLFFSHYLNSISSHDSFFNRAAKLALALKKDPPSILYPRQLYRIYRVLLSRTHVS